MAQRVLITAGAFGIGKEIAKTFAANGATVCVSLGPDPQHDSLKY